jgi:glycosyltransferase involved in cell wall biosynthesis
MTGEMASLPDRPVGPHPLYSVVIRAYNEEKYIGRLLEGILHQTVKEQVEIIIVDSGSTDATISIARRYPVQVVQIQPGEFTFGKSLNRGISQAQGEFIIIASAHVFPVYPDWIERLVAPFSDQKVALTYGKQRGNSSTKFSEHQVFARWFPETSNPNQLHPFCNNANAAIRRSVWQDHHYDESLSGLEDLAWAQVVIDIGHTIAYVAEAEIIHVHDETPQGIYNRYRREAMAFKRIYPEERFRLWDLFRLITTNITSDLWHAGQDGQLFENFGGILWFRWMQFWGTYHGYRQSGPLTRQLRRTFYYPQGIKSKNASVERHVEPIRYNDAADSK